MKIPHINIEDAAFCLIILLFVLLLIFTFFYDIAVFVIIITVFFSIITIFFLPRITAYLWNRFIATKE